MSLVAKILTPSHVSLDLRDRTQWTVSVRGPSGEWEHRLTPRHAEILFVLADNPAGRSAPE